MGWMSRAGKQAAVAGLEVTVLSAVTQTEQEEPHMSCHRVPVKHSSSITRTCGTVRDAIAASPRTELQSALSRQSEDSHTLHGVILFRYE